MGVELTDFKMNDYYKLLNLKPSASEPEIKRSFHNLAKQLHPDKLNNTELTDKQKEEKQDKFKQQDLQSKLKRQSKDQERYVEQLNRRREKARQKIRETREARSQEEAFNSNTPYQNQDEMPFRNPHLPTSSNQPAGFPFTNSIFQSPDLQTNSQMPSQSTTKNTRMDDAMQQVLNSMGVISNGRLRNYNSPAYQNNPVFFTQTY